MENLKEYLVKTEDGEYHFIPNGQKVGPTGEWIEIPEGADAYIQYKKGEHELFIKISNPSQYWDFGRWCNVAKGYETLQSFIDDGDKIFWKRDAGLNDNACVELSEDKNIKNLIGCKFEVDRAFDDAEKFGCGFLLISSVCTVKRLDPDTVKITRKDSKPSAELSDSVNIEFEWGADSTLGPELNQSDINYRTAKAFNEIRQANALTEDDVRLVLELVQLVREHG